MIVQSAERHIVRAKEWHPLGDVAPGDGLRIGHDLLARPQRMEREAGVWEKLHHKLLDRLGQADEIDWQRASLDSASVAAPGGATRPAESDG